MRRNVLIDPNMFDLHDETDIRDNLDFFHDVIELCNSGKLSVIVYQGLFEKIASWTYQPFPIDISKLRDSRLKSQIMILNHNFIQVMATGILCNDIDACHGSQDFRSVPDLSDDSAYFELLNVMLSVCYNHKVRIDPYVLIGTLARGQKDESRISLDCNCEAHDFHRSYEWHTPDYFEDEKDKAFHILQYAVANEKLRFVENPETVRADHHCPLQKKTIQKYQDISAKNKRVLNLLRYFGLYKLILSDYSVDSSYVPGMITVRNIRNGKDCEIVEGWLFCETGYKSHIELYFPVGIGRSICIYLSNMFSYKGVESLKTKLSV